MKTNSEESALNSAVTTKNHYGDTGVPSITRLHKKYGPNHLMDKETILGIKRLHNAIYSWVITSKASDSLHSLLSF